MENNQSLKTKKTISPDWLLKGILTKLGETFDRLTGRNWKPSSSLATSELIERIKKLLDSEAKDFDSKGKFVPHNIKLKMQWDKFSTDSDKSIEKLQNELHIAVIDHINDKRYYTYAPINIEIKPDYFTDGVKLLASFDKFDEEEREAAVDVSMPELKGKISYPEPEKIVEPEKETFIVGFLQNGKQKEVELKFGLGERKSIGRTKENDLMIDDASVSKVHAAFVFNSHSKLMLADTGSTNGTFINGQRIVYGRAFVVNEGDSLKFGTVEVSLKHIAKEPEIIEEIQGNSGVFPTEVIKPPEQINTKTEEFSPEESSNLSEIFKTADEQKNFRDSTEFSKTDFNKSEEVQPTQQGIKLDFDENKSN